MARIFLEVQGCFENSTDLILSFVLRYLLKIPHFCIRPFQSEFPAGSIKREPAFFIKTTGTAVFFQDPEDSPRIPFLHKIGKTEIQPLLSSPRTPGFWQKIERTNFPHFFRIVQLPGRPEDGDALGFLPCIEEVGFFLALPEMPAEDLRPFLGCESREVRGREDITVCRLPGGGMDRRESFRLFRQRPDRFKMLPWRFPKL